MTIRYNNIYPTGKPNAMQRKAWTIALCAAMNEQMRYVSLKRSAVYAQFLYRNNSGFSGRLPMPKHSPPAASQTLNFPPMDMAASIHAPFVYFDNAPTYGLQGNVACITLEANRMISVGADPGPVHMDRVVVAHLRMSINAAASLKAAIDAVLLAAAPVSSEAKN
jgi:hypothetical protein